jgi:hypothetical protein
MLICIMRFAELGTLPWSPCVSITTIFDRFSFVLTDPSKSLGSKRENCLYEVHKDVMNMHFQFDLRIF